MPSIIDRITQAEAEAAAYKRDAAAKARETIIEAGNEAQQELAAARDQGREELLAAQMRAEKEGEEIAQGICQSKAQEADRVCDEARAHMDEAVSYILKKVTEA